MIDSFGVAAGCVLLGVLGTAALLRNSGLDAPLALPTLPELEVTAQRDASDASADPLERAEAAFAAGRVLEPEGDNALYFFQLALEREPANATARSGLRQTIGVALSSGETALFQNEFDRAQQVAERVLQVAPKAEDARELRQRAIRSREVEGLMSEASGHTLAGRIDGPRGFNAVSSYRKVLRLQADHAGARAALAALAQRVLANAQTATLAGDLETGLEFLTRARRIYPNLPNYAEVERSLRNFRQEDRGSDVTSLLEAAALALQSDQLIAPAADNALDLYEAALQLAPDSKAAAEGRRLTVAALLERASAQIRDEDFAAASATLDSAAEAGAEAGDIAVVRADLAYSERGAAARRGELDELVSLGELRALRQVNPKYEDVRLSTAREGWVEVLFTVAEDGRVVDAEVNDSSSTVFHRVALSSIKRWRFEPYEVDGRPVPVRSGIRFSFVP